MDKRYHFKIWPRASVRREYATAERPAGAAEGRDGCVSEGSLLSSRRPIRGPATASVTQRTTPAFSIGLALLFIIIVLVASTAAARGRRCECGLDAMAL